MIRLQDGTVITENHPCYDMIMYANQHVQEIRENREKNKSMTFEEIEQLAIKHGQEFARLHFEAELRIRGMRGNEVESTETSKNRL
jgi:hypothetical protein